LGLLSHAERSEDRKQRGSYFRRRFLARSYFRNWQFSSVVCRIKRFIK